MGWNQIQQSPAVRWILVFRIMHNHLGESSCRLRLRLVETFAAEPKYAIGSRSIILPGDGCSQLHQLWRGKALLQSLA